MPWHLKLLSYRSICLGILSKLLDPVKFIANLLKVKIATPITRKMNMPLEIRLRLTLVMGFPDLVAAAGAANPPIFALTALIFPLLSVCAW